MEVQTGDRFLLLSPGGGGYGPVNEPATDAAVGIV